MNFGPRRSLIDAAPRTQRKRLEDFKSTAKENADKQGVSISTLPAHGLQTKYLNDKKTATIGKQIFQQQDKPVNSTSHINYWEHDKNNLH